MATSSARVFSRTIFLEYRPLKRSAGIPARVSAQREYVSVHARLRPRWPRLHTAPTSQSLAFAITKTLDNFF